LPPPSPSAAVGAVPTEDDEDDEDDEYACVASGRIGVDGEAD
jgi:hypothetical protein